MNAGADGSSLAASASSDASAAAAISSRQATMRSSSYANIAESSMTSTVRSAGRRARSGSTLSTYSWFSATKIAAPASRSWYSSSLLDDVG